MPLSFASINREYTIQKINGKDSVRMHLKNLGFVEKETIFVRQKINESLIVEVKGVRIALDATLSRRIFV